MPPSEAPVPEAEAPVPVAKAPEAEPPRDVAPARRAPTVSDCRPRKKRVEAPSAKPPAGGGEAVAEAPGSLRPQPPSSDRHRLTADSAWPRLRSPSRRRGRRGSRVTSWVAVQPAAERDAPRDARAAARQPDHAERRRREGGARRVDRLLRSGRGPRHPVQGDRDCAGKFDPNDSAARATGDDSYAYEKKKIAEATFEERLCLADEAARRRQQDALFHLKDWLEKLAQAPGLTTAERREALFELWDECLDDGGEGRPNLGGAARATVIAFIRRTFPAGGVERYTAAELAAFNRRRTSRVAFDPEAPSPPAE